MFLIEIAAPADALTDGDRATLTRAVTGLLNESASAPEETMARGRAITHITFRELAGWTTGDGAGPGPAGTSGSTWPASRTAASGSTADQRRRTS